MVELLISSGLGEIDYGFSKTDKQIKYRELALVMNKQGFTNRLGQPLNSNTLK